MTPWHKTLDPLRAQQRAERKALLEAHERQAEEMKDRHRRELEAASERARHEWIGMLANVRVRYIVSGGRRERDLVVLGRKLDERRWEIAVCQDGMWATMAIPETGRAGYEPWGMRVGLSRARILGVEEVRGE